MPARIMGTVGFAVGAAFAFVTLAIFTGNGYASSERVEVVDDCDPASFNAVIGPGTCVGDGETTFAAFIAELIANKRVEAWAFDPDKLGVEAGQTIAIVSDGGEFHTFTRVAEFGGGFVPILNILSGNPVPRSECTTGAVVNGELQPQPFSATNIPVPAGGGSGSISTGLGGTLSVGVHRFQCCIHPWMRTTITVEGNN